MQNNQGSENELRILNLKCPCGVMLTGKGEDALVASAQAHLRAEHPELVSKYSREDILAFAL